MLDKEYSIILYHGSDCIVKKPEISKCENFKDFGKGFYLTKDKKQAKRFAKMVMLRNGSKQCYVNKYLFKLNVKLNIHYFESSNAEWFKFVCTNRNKTLKLTKIADNKYDVVVGKIADDSTAIVINNFLSGTYGKQNQQKTIDFAISLLLPNRLSEQICLKTEKAISFLEFLECEEV